MPNWCQNQLTVQDATPELRAYLEHNGFFFPRMVPPPPLADPGDDSAAAAQQEAAWGTKWELGEDEGRMVAADLLSGGVSFFDTAWSPPNRDGARRVVPISERTEGVASRCIRGSFGSTGAYSPNHAPASFMY
jgi:hypothetical protein